MANGLIYKIPRFQRDYTWTEENWEDLWLDIVDLIADGGDDSHYMGYLVLQSKGGKERTIDVIDGQQRLTTLSIFVLAGLRVLKRLVQDGVEPENNERRMEEIRRNYIGQTDSVSLQTQSKLSLNRNNDGFYQTYLVTLRVPPSRGLIASDHLLRKAADWFERKITEHVESLAIEESAKGRAVAEMIERVSDGLFFTVITDIGSVAQMG